MRSPHIHPGWELAIYLSLAAFGIAAVASGTSEPETVCALIA